MWFTAQDLAQAVPRMPDPPADPTELEPDPDSDIDMPDVDDGLSSLSGRPGMEERNVVRVHTFRFDGNITVSSHYV
jgi:hypothetical protein